MQLSQTRLAKVSTVSSEAAQVFFSAVFIEPILNNKASAVLTAAGGLLALLFWTISVIIIDD